MDNWQDKRKTLVHPWPSVLETASVQNWDSPALHISVSLQQPAVLSLYEFCKILLPYLNPPEYATVCLVYYWYITLQYLTRNYQQLALIKSHHFFSVSQTMDLKVAHTPSTLELPKDLWMQAACVLSLPFLVLSNDVHSWACHIFKGKWTSCFPYVSHYIALYYITL